jgi:hypothetical protein
MKTEPSSHILAFTEAAWQTAAGFEAAIIFSQTLGLRSMTVLPILFKGNLEKAEVAEIAKRHDMKLICCGFRAQAEISPYTPEGIQPAIEDFQDQFLWQDYFNESGVGDRFVVGPIPDDWGANKSKFSLSGLRNYCEALAGLGRSMGITICAEIVNRHESGINDPQLCIPYIISDLNDPFLRLHADIVHLASYLGMEHVIAFIMKYSRIIDVLELGMPDRMPMNSVEGFKVIADELFALLGGPLAHVKVSLEPFDYDAVIKPFALEEVYGFRGKGTDTLEADVRFLAEKGLLRDRAPVGA